MAKFKGYATVTMRIPISFELDDEDAEDERVIDENALFAAEDAMFAVAGTVQQVDVDKVERIGGGK